jgi:uncharacterized membrane protein
MINLCHDTCVLSCARIHARSLDITSMLARLVYRIDWILFLTFLVSCVIFFQIAKIWMFVTSQISQQEALTIIMILTVIPCCICLYLGVVVTIKFLLRYYKEPGPLSLKSKNPQDYGAISGSHANV